MHVPYTRLPRISGLPRATVNSQVYKRANKRLAAIPTRGADIGLCAANNGVAGARVEPRKSGKTAFATEVGAPKNGLAVEAARDIKCAWIARRQHVVSVQVAHFLGKPQQRILV